MDIPISQAKFRCGCGNFIGSEQQLRGHQRHRKSPDCKKPRTIVLDESVLPTGAPSGEATPSGLDELLGTPPVAERDPWEGWDPPGADGTGADGQKGSSRADDDRARVMDGKGPTMISERVALPVTIRTYYDTWVARLGYEGTFEGWICELIEQFHDLAGFELTVVVQVPSEVPGELHLQGANGSRQ